VFSFLIVAVSSIGALVCIIIQKDENRNLFMPLYKSVGRTTADGDRIA
jgi:hypothetical protein